eukprot:6033652-Prymnesium_polylepis.1
MVNKAVLHQIAQARSVEAQSSIADDPIDGDPHVRLGALTSQLRDALKGKVPLPYGSAPAVRAGAPASTSGTGEDASLKAAPRLGLKQSIYFCTSAEVQAAVQKGCRPGRMRREHRKIAWIVGIVTAYILLGVIVYTSIENWTPGGAFYFAVVTMTTVGYGDFVPSHTWSKVFTVFYMLAGVMVVFIQLGDLVIFVYDQTKDNITTNVRRVLHAAQEAQRNLVDYGSAGEKQSEAIHRKLQAEVDFYTAKPSAAIAFYAPRLLAWAVILCAIFLAAAACFVAM